MRLNHVRRLVDWLTARVAWRSLGWLAPLAAVAPFFIWFAATMPPVEQPFGYYSENPVAFALAAMDGPAAGDDRHLRTPKFVKGIYVTADTVSYRPRFDKLVSLVKRTELNAMVIDLKNHRHELAFATDNPELQPYVANRPSLGRLEELTAELHRSGIYLIARFPVMQDPLFAAKHPESAVRSADGGLWRDNRGLLWLDPADENVWRYAAAIAREAHAAGFDEIQFDYVRFPSDGPLKTIRYPHFDGSQRKFEALAEFFSYLDVELRRKLRMPISADLFGLVMWHHGDDMNIGQRLDASLQYFDFISPMVYPSHYPNGFDGFANPAAHPYEIILRNMRRGQALRERLLVERSDERWGTFRPWLQDFHLGATYDAVKVRDQIRAAVEGGASGWLLWNAGNVYTEAALEAEAASQ